jgi:hypothetical protein
MISLKGNIKRIIIDRKIKFIFIHIYSLFKSKKMSRNRASNPAKESKTIAEKKNENSARIAERSKESIISLNLEKYADQLSGMQLKEKKEKDTIYHYPPEFDKSMISSEKGKKYRNSLRNRLKRHSNNVLIFAKIKDAEKLQKEIEDFQKFYAEFFRLNDYSLASISHSSDPIKEKDFSLFLQIVKDCKLS